MYYCSCWVSFLSFTLHVDSSFSFHDLPWTPNLFCFMQRIIFLEWLTLVRSCLCFKTTSHTVLRLKCLGQGIRQLHFKLALLQRLKHFSVCESLSVPVINVYCSFNLALWKDSAQQPENLSISGIDVYLRERQSGSMFASYLLDNSVQQIFCFTL